jgi:hemerythrin-like domain-containing protein
MDRPTEHLMQDHALATRCVRCLARMAEEVVAGSPFPANDVAAALRFLREWVVAVHMRKEDELLAPAVAMRGDEQSAQIVGELFRLREEIEELLHSLVLFWEPLGELTVQERAGFGAAVEALVRRLERRQELEEQVLFPDCARYVPADDQLHWLGEFERVETERGRRSDWSGQIEGLANRWLD